jgi:acetone carboxylase beta subunit
MLQTGAQGRSVIAVRPTEARDAVRELLASGARVIVICLLRWRKNGRQQRRRAGPDRYT